MKFLTALGAGLGAAVLATVGSLTTAAAADTFSCADRVGGVGGVPGSITAVRAAHHEGYDRVVFEFAPGAAGGLPSYRLAQQASANFKKDPSDLPVSLRGSAGLRAVFQNTTIAASVPSDLVPELPVIREVAELGEFERVSSYGIGLSNAACFRVLEIGNTRLAIDFASPGQAAAGGEGSSTSGAVAQAGSPGDASAAAAVGSLPDAAAGTPPAALLVARPQPAKSGSAGSSPLWIVLGFAALAACAVILFRRRFRRGA